MPARRCGACLYMYTLRNWVSSNAVALFDDLYQSRPLDKARLPRNYVLIRLEKVSAV